jgi:transcriptional regulator with XRE-family HTH domain
MENSFGEKLKGLRAKAGLTQESLAKELAVSRTLITKWETGKADPTESSLERIAEYFHVEKGYLVDDDEVRKIALETSRRQRVGYRAADFTLLISASFFIAFGLTTIAASLITTPRGARDDNFSELSVEAMNGLLWFMLGVYGAAIGIALLAALGIRRLVLWRKRRNA